MTAGSPGRPLGLVYDLDGALPIGAVRHPLRRLRKQVRQDRRSVMGMSGVLRALVAAGEDTPVVYLTGVPRHVAGLLSRLLRHDGYPPGELVVREDTADPVQLVRGGRAHKHTVGAGALAARPDLRWVLVGDDGSADPDLYGDLVRRFPGRVAAVALREGRAGDGSHRLQRLERALGARHVPLLCAPNGEELLPLLESALGVLPRSRGTVEDWLLTDRERGNPATRLRAWTEGNAVRPLVHGRSYFPVLAGALAATGRGDVLSLAGWRADPDEWLTGTGTTVADALAGAARRGTRVRGLLWRSHARALRYHVRENRALATAVNAAGGEVLLDQRVRPLGSHHQKMVTVRHAGRPAADVAFLGGIDLAHARADDAGHAGDPQTRDFAAVYGPTPAWHDVHVELRGPAVRDVEQVFRERWADPAALVRLPWQVVPDLLHRLPRGAAPLPPALPDPPAAGSCAVQVLRTYPRRWPRSPFAPRGERSIARAYAKALHRAQRIVYVEDQYLWSLDVARVFAAALRRAPRLHLVAVIPRYPDQEAPLYLDSARLGQTDALAMVHDAGGERVQVLDIENRAGLPVYVHAKVCVIDDVWATIGSDNFNVRSWTHDSELTAAVLDDDRDLRAPADPAGLGDGARRFARDLRLQLMGEHLDRPDPADRGDLLDPDTAADAIRSSAAALNAWYDGGCSGPRPPGRLRRHAVDLPSPWHLWATGPAYRTALDPDGRPLGMRLRRTF